MALLQLAFFFTDNFHLLIVIRFFVGMAIPAVLTSIMTYISTVTKRETVQKQMAYYISSTILGGFAGRFFSGLIASYFGWRWTFLILAFSLSLAFVLIRSLHEAEIQISKFSVRSVLDVLKKRQFATIYLLIFATFFTFAAILNFIPFRVREISAGSSSFTIGIMYMGYIMGIVMSLNALRIIKIFGGEMNTVFTALVFYACTLFLFTYPSLYVMFFGMFLFCCGMFLAHSVASGYVNKIAEDKKGDNQRTVCFLLLRRRNLRFIPSGVCLQQVRVECFSASDRFCGFCFHRRCVVHAGKAENFRLTSLYRYL
ncbi:MAG: MFS transporter [Geovibrio sp.]|nr:MFS transporter [Geovibrio sp.]